MSRVNFQKNMFYPKKVPKGLVVVSGANSPQKIGNQWQEEGKEDMIEYPQFTPQEYVGIKIIHKYRESLSKIAQLNEAKGCAKYKIKII